MMHFIKKLKKENERTTDNERTFGINNLGRSESTRMEHHVTVSCEGDNFISGEWRPATGLPFMKFAFLIFYYSTE